MTLADIQALAINPRPPAHSMLGHILAACIRVSMVASPGPPLTVVWRIPLPRRWRSTPEPLVCALSWGQMAACMRVLMVAQAGRPLTAATDTSVRALAIDPQTQARSMQGRGSTGYSSIDSGASWSGASVSLTQPVYTLTIDPQTPSTLYAGTFNGGVYKSINGGAS